MGIPGFDDVETYDQMNRRMARALREDRQDRKDRNKQILQFAHGHEEGNVLNHTVVEGIKHMRTMRVLFKGNIIRREPDSKNWEGKAILGLKPHQDVYVYLKPSEYERNFMSKWVDSTIHSSLNDRGSKKVGCSKLIEIIQCRLIVLRRHST